MSLHRGVEDARDGLPASAADVVLAWHCAATSWDDRTATVATSSAAIPKAIAIRVPKLMPAATSVGKAKLALSAPDYILWHDITYYNADD